MCVCERESMQSNQTLIGHSDDVILFPPSKDVHDLAGIMQLMFGANLRGREREKYISMYEG